MVTGAGGGIGRALVDALRACEAEVVAIDLRRSFDLAPLPAGVATFACDLTNQHEVEGVFREVGARFAALDGFVGLAGFARAKAPFGELPAETWDEVLDGNLGTTVLPLKAALPWLRKGDEPAIVTMASGLAQKPAPGYGSYGVAKAGVIALTKLIAAEEAPRIRANAVAPAAVDTAFLRGGTAHGVPNQPMRIDLDAYLRTVPLGRLAKPEEVVGPILFLLSPAARYVTGQTLHINGGSLMP